MQMSFTLTNLLSINPLHTNLLIGPTYRSNPCTDDALYYLGEDKLVRLLRIDWAVENVDKEYKWLSKIAPGHNILLLQKVKDANERL
jgi:hypothetical protein